MAKYFSRQVSKKFSVAAIIPPREKETWVSLHNEDMMSQLKGQVFAVESFSVHTSDSTSWSPFIVTWSSLDLVKRNVSLKKDGDTTIVHGFADSNQRRKDWERCIDVPPILCHNIWQFFLSDIQVAYMKLMKDVCDKKGRLAECCPLGTRKMFYADAVKEIGLIDCYLSPVDRNDGGDQIMNFITSVMACSQMEEIYNALSQPYLDRLTRYGVDLETSYNDIIPIYNDSHFLFPLDAIRKLLTFFQELENNNFMYCIPDNKQIDPITFSVCLPKNDKPVIVTADIEVLIGMSQSDHCCIACQEDDLEDMQVRSDARVTPNILSMSEKLDLETTEEAMERNLTTAKGIGAVRKKGYVSFEVK
jgi:hypothetical protein